MIHAQSSLAEIDAAIAAKRLSLTKAHAILAPRAARTESKSGARAAAWIEANPLKVAKTPKAPAAKAPRITPAAAKAAADSAKVETYKTRAAAYATSKFGALKTLDAAGKGEWWAAYRVYTARVRAMQAELANA